MFRVASIGRGLIIFVGMTCFRTVARFCHRTTLSAMLPISQIDRVFVVLSQLNLPRQLHLSPSVLDIELPKDEVEWRSTNQVLVDVPIRQKSIRYFTDDTKKHPAWTREIKIRCGLDLYFKIGRVGLPVIQPFARNRINLYLSAYLNNLRTIPRMSIMLKKLSLIIQPSETP